MENDSTSHKIIIGAAQNMEKIKNNSIELVVTSPPYPMIEMWDEIMAKQNPIDAAKTVNKKLVTIPSRRIFRYSVFL